MKNTIDLENMVRLINAYDAFEVIAKSIEVVTGADYRYGTIGKMYELLEVIESYTVLETEPDENEDMSEFDRVILDTDKSAVERAKLILGLQ